ncbi:MAG: amidohydrolase family protein [Salinibacter sp.]
MTAPLPRRTVGAAALGLALLLWVASAGGAQAQEYDVPRVTDTYAITGARVVQAPGQVLESATVVVRDGLIEAVGPDVEVPYDARRITGDSLVVYAGFIDGLSHAGVEMPEDENTDDGEGDGSGDENVDPGNPPPGRAGIQPDRVVRSFLSPDASGLDDLRKAGFTAGHVVPEGEMLPGHGAYIFYGGETVTDMMMAPSPTLFAQIQPAEGYVYPATEMAVLAKMRQLVRETERRETLRAAYEEDPTGRRQPPQDPVHSALVPVLDGTMPMAFYADDALSIHRVLNLQNELGVPLVLAGLAEGHEAVEALQDTDAPLFLTLDLPEPPTRTAAGDTTVADTTDAPSRYYTPEFRVPSYRQVAEEEENLELRHAMERQDYLETAATLEDAGLEFGFTTREATPGDIRAHLRTMVDQGLSEQAALAALTTRPAAHLGLSDRLGTVEAGKVANLVVTDGSYFAEDTSVRQVFVDGRLYDYATETSGGEITGDISAVVGTWSYTLETPQGEVSGTITFEGDASSLEGTFTGPEGEEQVEQEDVLYVAEECVEDVLREGRYDDDGTTLSFTVPSDEGSPLSVTVTVKEGAFEGSASVQGRSLSISGERTSAPSETRK